MLSRIRCNTGRIRKHLQVSNNEPMPARNAFAARALRTANRLVLFFACWLILTDGQADGLFIGGLVALAATLLANRLIPPDRRLPGTWRLLSLAPGFLWRSFKGGTDVARRVFDPRLPLKPGWIEYPARVRAGTPRVILAGEITLLPGTLVAGSRGGRLLIHCLDTDMPVTRQIADEEDRFRQAIGDE